MPRINILYVITKLELGGAQKQLLSLISNLDKEKFNLFLFTAREGLLVNQALSIKGLSLIRSKYLERPVNIFKDILAFAEIYRFIKKNRIQIIHTHSSKAGILGRLAARAAKLKVIIHTVHGWSFNDYQIKQVKSLYLMLERYCGAFTTKIIVVCAYDKQKGLDNLIGRSRQYAVVRYGIDHDEFACSGQRFLARETFGIGKDEFAVGTVACFKEQKAPLDFIKMASEVKKKLPNAKFIMVGDGALRKRICSMIEKMGLQKEIVLTGWRNDIAFILQALDIFALTSLWEGMPVAVLEASAAGVVVVATDTGGIREAVEDSRTGYLVPAKNHQEMQARISELLTNEHKRNEFARSAKEKICSGEFSAIKIAKDTEELYFNLWKENESD